MRERWFSRAEEVSAMIGPNYNATGVHIGNFRSHLDEIAERLSENRGRSVNTRFDPDFNHAELHHDDNEVIAQIRVHCAEWCEAIVRSDLPTDAKALFSRFLPVRVVFQTLDGR